MCPRWPQRLPPASQAASPLGSAGSAGTEGLADERCVTRTGVNGRVCGSPGSYPMQSFPRKLQSTIIPRSTVNVVLQRRLMVLPPYDLV